MSPHTCNNGARDNVRRNFWICQIFRFFTHKKARNLRGRSTTVRQRNHSQRVVGRLAPFPMADTSVGSHRARRSQKLRITASMARNAKSGLRWTPSYHLSGFLNWKSRPSPSLLRSSYHSEGLLLLLRPWGMWATLGSGPVVPSRHTATGVLLPSV
jgi:hypothetical protein